MCAVQPPSAAANTFAVKETSFPLSSVSIHASDGELGHINGQSSSSKPRARHSLLKNLIWLHFQICHPENGNSINVSGIRRVYFANSERNTKERVRKSSIM
jgi:hypothetical protein